MILCADPSAQFQSNKKEIEEAVIRVLRSNNFILGEEVETLEKEFASFIGSKYCVGVANGTEAIELALKCLGIGVGDEVISVSHTATASISAICATNATPVLVDVEPEFYNINIDEIKKVINKKTKAILAVHLYGHPCKILDLKELCNLKNIFLIEDCSQAHGAKIRNKKLGNFGDISCFSCYPTKNLGAIGDAGLITTNNKKYLDKLIKLRQYGWNNNRESLFNGRNSRLDEIQAAILRVKLKKLNDSNLKRREIAKFYLKHLKDLPLILPKEDIHSYHVYHLFVIRLLNKNLRTELINFFKKNGIFLGVHYPMPTHKQKGFKNIIVNSRKLSVTENISKKIISLPIYPELKKQQIQKVVNLLKNFFKNIQDVTY